MSILKRIEETYLDILRFIIIAAASLLLLGTIVFAALAGNNWGHSSAKNDQANVVIISDAVTEKVVAAKTNAPTGKPTPAVELGADANATDPNQPLYERTATAIQNFVAKYGRGIEIVAKDKVINITRNKAQQFQDAAVITEFAQGLATTMEKTLADPKILKLLESVAPVAPQVPPQVAEGEQVEQPAEVPRLFRVSPIEIVEETLTAYTRLFKQQLEVKERAKEKAALEELERKASAMTQLYVAGGAFGAFLLLVFISIVVKIERNLRTLTPPLKVATGQSAI